MCGPLSQRSTADLPHQRWIDVTYHKSKDDVAIVRVEQYFDFAHGLADRFHLLRCGAVAMHGGRAELAPETLFKKDREWTQKGA